MKFISSIKGVEMKKDILFLVVGIVFLVVFLSSATWAVWSPPDNAWPDAQGIDWENNVAFAIGIPTYTQGASVSAGASATQIQSCLNGLSANEYCYMNAGSYNIGSTQINIPANGELRGAGSDQTFITYTGTQTAFRLAGGGSGGSEISISNVNFGSTTITVTGDASSLSVGDIVSLQEEEDNDLVDSGGCNWCGDDGGGHFVSQFVKITNKNGDVLTVDRPAYFTYDTSPSVRKYGMASGAGISGVYIDCTASSGNGALIRAREAQNCFVNDVEVNEVSGAAVKLEFSRGCTIANSYFHHADGYGSGRGYLIWLMWLNSDHYIYNNIVDWARYGINLEGGGTGNIFAYNYIRNVREGDEIAWLHAGIGFHGAHPTANLMEGNMLPSIIPDNTWGSSSHGMIFRNYIAREDYIDWTINYGKWCIDVEMNSLYYSSVGNVLGYSGMDGIYERNSATNSPSIYRFGCSGPGCYSWNNDAFSTFYRHGDYDYITDSVVWNGGDDQNLPNSLYLSSKPSWWDDQGAGRPWPSIGPDIIGEDSMYYTDIPAKDRYEGEMYAGATCTIPSDCPDNGNFCDGTETCQSGNCVSTGNPCTDDGYRCTTLCDETTDSCNVPSDILCDDGFACTTDSCIGTGGDANGCFYSFNTNSCNDGKSCTENDVCSLGSCLGTPNDNLCLPLPSDCTSTTCDSNLGCVYQPSSCDVASGLVSWLKFDEGSGITASDSSGNNNDGTISGATWTTGKIDGALEFTGDADYVEVGTSNFNVNTGTLSFWVLANAFDSIDENYFFGHTTLPAWGNRIQLYTDDANGNLDLGLGDTHATATNIFDLNTGIWYHIALTWDSTNYDVYVDSVSRANGAYSGLSSINSFADIGNNGNSASRTEAWNGIIDDVRVYNRVLSSSEILEIYNQGTQSCSPADTSGEGVVDMIELIAYIGRWKNNDGVDMIDLIEAIGIWKGGGC